VLSHAGTAPIIFPANSLARRLQAYALDLFTTFEIGYIPLANDVIIMGEQNIGCGRTEAAVPAPVQCRPETMLSPYQRLHQGMGGAGLALHSRRTSK
jgi:hypothetical protein